MHDAAFARAAVQPPLTLLRLPLRRYSIGHELLISTMEPTAGIGAGLLFPELASLYQALLGGIWICAHSWEENRRLRSELLIGLKVWLWSRYVRRQDLDAALVRFIAYRNAGSTWPPSQTPPDAMGREPGSPFLLRLQRFIMQDARLDESAAWDYPLGLAQWRWSAYWEAQGGLDVLNEGEIDFERWCEEQDAAAAAVQSPKSKVQSREVARA